MTGRSDLSITEYMLNPLDTPSWCAKYVLVDLRATISLFHQEGRADEGKLLQKEHK